MSEHNTLNASISRRLKERRKEKGWSLDTTSRETGVSKAMLGQIERHESSPTIATLWKIATGLGYSFSSFFNDDDAPNATKSEPVKADFSFDPNMQVTTLFAYSAITRIETFEITLLNHHCQMSSAHQTGVLEHLHVLEGELAVQEGEKTYSIGPGEQFLLKADQPHSYKDKAGKTRFLDIIFYP